jgi:oleate hydratase
VKVFWGYGLFPDGIGDYVPKKMSECTGEEILTELLHHLHFQEDMEAISPPPTVFHV